MKRPRPRRQPNSLSKRVGWLLSRGHHDRPSPAYLRQLVGALDVVRLEDQRHWHDLTTGLERRSLTELHRIQKLVHMGTSGWGRCSDCGSMGSVQAVYERSRDVFVGCWCLGCCEGVLRAPEAPLPPVPQPATLVRGGA